MDLDVAIHLTLSSMGDFTDQRQKSSEVVIHFWICLFQMGNRNKTLRKSRISGMVSTLDFLNKDKKHNGGGPSHRRIGLSIFSNLSAEWKIQIEAQKY